jgi:transglutaminase-like putative cysteine protease
MRPTGPGSAGPPDQPAPPVYLVPTLIGALAILAATIAIPPMISGEDWFWPTFEVVMVIWLVGVGARLARLPAVVVILLQVVGAGVALTALFTTGGIGGVIPNGAVIGEAGELLTGAWDQIRTTVSPTPASTELSFLICLSVGTTALIVDILIAVCRAPALVALPLLCVFSVPASIDLSMLPWQAFAAPAMLYALLLIASGLTGRRLGAGAGLAQVVNGVALAALATVIAVVVAGSVTGVGTAGRLPRTAAGPSAGIGLSPFASLQGNLLRSEPVDMLSVTGLTEPKYLRAMGLEEWTGQRWSIDQLTDGELPSAPLPTAQAVTVTALSYRAEFLPIYNGTTQVNGADPGWSYDAALGTVHRAEPLTPAPYVIDAVFAEPTAAELRADTARPGGLLTETGDLSPEVVAIATQVTGAATTAFDKAEALRTYFTDPANGFTYSLSVPLGDSGDQLLDFLNNKQGYCEQYASAMAVMLRAVGVPARVAIGFTQGERQSDGSYLISSNDAHAWVEVRFDNNGWVQFDPTPLTGGQGRQQGFAAEVGPVPSIGALPSDDVPSAGLGADEPTTRAGEPTAQPSQGAGGTDSAAAEPAVAPGWWVALAILALVAAAAAGPTVVRRRRRDHRLAAADAGGAGAAAAAWREIEDLAVGHGIGLNPAESARATANRLAKASHLSEHGRAELRVLVTAVERGWYASGAESSGDEPGGGSTSGGSTGGGSTAAGSTAGGSTAARSPAGGTPGGGSTAARSPGGGSPGGGSPGGGPSMATETLIRPAPEPLGAAPRTIALELQHHVPLAPLDRLVPRSVRPAWWRD